MTNNEWTSTEECLPACDGWYLTTSSLSKHSVIIVENCFYDGYGFRIYSDSSYFIPKFWRHVVKRKEKRYGKVVKDASDD